MEDVRARRRRRFVCLISINVTRYPRLCLSIGKQRLLWLTKHRNWVNWRFGFYYGGFYFVPHYQLSGHTTDEI